MIEFGVGEVLIIMAVTFVTGYVVGLFDGEEKWKRK